MSTFKRDNLHNKQTYYLLFIIVELLIIVSIFYFQIHWFLILLLLPILLIDIISNKRCLNRQKNFITQVDFINETIVCTHLDKTETILPFKKTKFSIRQRKFEKDQTEIEIKLKKSLKSTLIGRLHISNWSTIFELRDEFIKHKITQVKYNPEGYWSKYGGYTADIVILTSTLGLGEIAEFTGDTSGANDIRNIGFNSNFSSIHENKEDKKTNQQ